MSTHDGTTMHPNVVLGYGGYGQTKSFDAEAHRRRLTLWYYLHVLYT